MRIVQEMTLVRERLARRKWYVEAERSGIVVVTSCGHCGAASSASNGAEPKL